MRHKLKLEIHCHNSLVNCLRVSQFLQVIKFFERINLNMPLIQLWHCEVKPLITRVDRNIKLDYCFSVRKKYLSQHKEYLSIRHEKRSFHVYSAYHALLSNFFENCEWFHFAYFLWEILQVTEKTIGVLERSIECARKLGSSNFFISILLISYSTVSFIFE